MSALVITSDEFSDGIATVIWNEFYLVKLIVALYIISQDVIDDAFVCFIGMG